MKLVPRYTKKKKKKKNTRKTQTIEKIQNEIQTRNSSGDEIANVNFLYDDIVHALKIQ